MEEQNRFSEQKIFDKEEKSPTFDFVKLESLHILHVDDDASFLKSLDEGGETENCLEKRSPNIERNRYNILLSDFQDKRQR